MRREADRFAKVADEEEVEEVKGGGGSDDEGEEVDDATREAEEAALNTLKKRMESGVESGALVVAGAAAGGAVAGAAAGAAGADGAAPGCVPPSYVPPPPAWPSVPGYVPPGQPGFTAFARQMLYANSIPTNKRCLPPQELKPAEWSCGGGLNGELEPRNHPVTAVQPPCNHHTPLAGELKPRLQPYQEVVAYMARPEAYPNPRMLIVHRTGAGKTGTIIQVANSYFSDRRPKLVLFPSTAVCRNFYRELRNPHFPNRYDEIAAYFVSRRG
jgi:hypothetical protein